MPRYRELGSDPQYAPLIADVVAHPSGLVLPAEFAILNPGLSTTTIDERLTTLTEAGVFGSVQANTDEQRTYYYLTDDARATFDDNEMFAPEPLRELFDRIDHSDRFRELAEQPRPSVDAKTTSRPD